MNDVLKDATDLCRGINQSKIHVYRLVKELKGAEFWKVHVGRLD